MLLTVHNLPTHMRYADVKSLILSKCGLKEVILDNLVSDGRNSKRVTVGLAEEEDAALLVRHINGLYLEGRQLYVEDVRKKKSSDQPFRQSHNNYESSNTDTDRSNKQQSSYAPQVNYAQQMDYQQSQYPSQTAGWQADNFGNQQVVNPEQVMPLMMPYMAGMNMGGMYYMPQGQNSYMDYSSQQPQLTSTADQYPQFPYQQGQTGSGLGSQTVKEDNWSRKRRDGMCSSPGDNDNNHGTQSTYKSDPRQVSGGWARGRDMEPSRRRSRSPRNKRERSRDRSGISPKRARNEDNSRDFSRKGANFNRDSQRYPSDRDDSYTSQAYGNSYNASQNYANSNNTSQNYGNSNNTSQAYGNSNTPSQTYGNINQNRPYYNNEPVTATSSNNRPQPLLSLPTQNPWNSGTHDDNDNLKFQEQKSGGPSNSAASFQKKSHVPVWDRDNTSSLDDQSNYRKHMEMKASQNQSKSTWRNPMQSSWDRVVDSYEGDSRSQYSWTNKGQDKNDTKSSSWGGKSSAPGEIKPLMEKKPLLSSPPKSWERSSFDKHQPMKYEPKVHTNVPKKWPTKPKKNRGKGKTSVMPIIRQDSTSRFKAAGQIATEIAKAHPDIIKPEHVKNLRQSVRSRFEILLAERLGESLPQMIAIYRAKFPASQDREFCRLVVEQAPAESKTTVVDLTGPDVKTEIKREKPNPQVAKNQPPSARNQPTAAKNQPPVQRNQQKDRDYLPPWERKGKNQPGNSQQNKSKQPKLPRLQLPNPTDKLPKYPNSDKQVYKEQKKLKKLEHQNEDLYSLTPHLQQALDEELKNITDIFKSVASNADTEQEKGLCERFLSIGLEQVRKKYIKAHSKALETSTPEASEASETFTPENEASRITSPVRPKAAEKSISMIPENALVPNTCSALDTTKSTSSPALEVISSASSSFKAEHSVVSQTPGAGFEDSPKVYQSGGTSSQNSERNISNSQTLPCNASSESNDVPPTTKSKKSKKKRPSGAQKRKLRQLLAAQGQPNGTLGQNEQKTPTDDTLVSQITVTSASKVPEVVKLNVTKRLLNITTNLIIRVFVQGKPPKKQEVELFLRKHKIVSLKKSDKRKIVYIATCKDFNTYDRMLEMGSAPLNNETVLRFKPFQLVGPKLSFRERNEQRLQRLRGLEGSNTENATENFEDSADAKDEIIDISEELNEEEIKNEPKIEDVVENSTEPEEEVTENSTGPDVEEIMDNLEEEQQEQDAQNDDNDIIENVDDIDDVDEDDLEDY